MAQNSIYAYSHLRAFHEHRYFDTEQYNELKNEFADYEKTIASSNNEIIQAYSQMGYGAHANGTTNAEDIFIAGEEGPELIVGKRGSTVFPAEETNKILSAINDQPLYIPPSESPVSKQIEKISETTSRKEISLNINGSGSINVTGGVDKEQVVEIVLDNLRPAILNLLSQEVFEEVEGSYDY